MSDKVYIGPNKVGSFEKKGEYKPVSRVTMWYDDDDDHYFTAGDDTGREMRLNNPYATQVMVKNVLEAIKGKVYRPFEARDVIWDPTIELGDGINIGGIYSMLGHVDMTFGPEIIANISCPGGNVIDNELPWIDPKDLELKRRVKLGQKYQGVQIDRRNGLTITETDGETTGAKVVLNSKELTFYDVGGGKVLYFDPVSKTYKFMGELNVNNNFIVDKLGNVKMNGGINLKGPVTWGDNIPNKKRYAASTSGPWHDTMQSGDIYCCDWDYTAEKWGEPYKFKGQDGTNGRPGSDADVTRDNLVLAMVDALEQDGLYTFDGTDGEQYLGIKASAIKTGVLKAIEIEGCTYYSKNRVGVLKLSDDRGEYSDLTFSNNDGYDLFSVVDGIGGASLYLMGEKVLWVNKGGSAGLGDNVNVTAVFA